ncbi:hypothetical protein [Paenibacillus sp. Marseille-Q9583]
MKFRKKPVIVDAVQYTPGLEDGYACYVVGGGRFVGYHDKRTPIPPAFRKVPAIKTLSGFEEIYADDWIITGERGNRYVCDPETFAQTYEAATRGTDGPPHEDEAHALIRETYSYYNAAEDFAEGIVYALDTLGIKIEGVNA